MEVSVDQSAVIVIVPGTLLFRVVRFGWRCVPARMELQLRGESTESLEGSEHEIDIATDKFE